MQIISASITSSDEIRSQLNLALIEAVNILWWKMIGLFWRENLLKWTSSGCKRGAGDMGGKSTGIRFFISAESGFLYSSGVVEDSTWNRRERWKNLLELLCALSLTRDSANLESKALLDHSSPCLAAHRVLTADGIYCFSLGDNCTAQESWWNSFPHNQPQHFSGFICCSLEHVLELQEPIFHPQMFTNPFIPAQSSSV